MNTKDWLHRKLPLLALLLALLLFVMSMASNDIGSDTDKTARETAERVERRLAILDEYIAKAQATDRKELILPEGLPDDMVIYRYINDSLQSWSNQFSIINDDISSRLVFHRLTDRSSALTSPLSEAGEDITYLNIGPKWYLAKAVTSPDNQKIIAGLEIKNNLIDDARKNENGVNPSLRLSRKYSVIPLSNSGGSAVVIYDVPQFKILYDASQATPFFDNSMLRWMAILLLTVAIILFFAGHRSLKVYGTVTVTLTLLFLMALIWGMQMSGASDLFSPTIYADGTLFYSLGALILINTYITLLSTCTFLVRKRIAALARKDWKHKRRNLAIYGTVTLFIAIATAIYTHLTLKSLLMNSNVSMELYRWNMNIPYTVLVYLSYTGLLFSILLQVHALGPTVKEFLGFRYDLLSPKTLILFAIACSVYFTVTSSYLGFVKEHDRVSVWANRLSVERDLSLEIQLRSAEENIAYDRLISALTFLENTGGMIQNRISEYYLPRARQAYNIDVKVFKDGDRNGLSLFNNVTRAGTPIAGGSRFFFVTDANGRSSYAGIFMFYNAREGISRMILTIEPNSNREDRGYYSILGRFSKPGDINIPNYYSYAKYKDGRLTSYKGNYPYPTYYDYISKGYLIDSKHDVARIKGYVHFMNLVSENELIVISRQKRSGLVYFTSFSYLCLILSAILSIFARSQKKKDGLFKSNYFKTRINTILFVSSFLILVSMTVISVFFVYKRNEENMYNLMSSRITTVQALVERQARTARDWQDLDTQEFTAILENISNSTKCDITLYTPGGKVFRSTTPEVFERMIMGSRLDEEAYYNIRDLSQRYFIHREKITDYRYWVMYAPVFNDKGHMVAIVGTPYTDRSFDFQREAFFHAALIINLFLLLLIGSLLFSTREVNSLFAPLLEMGKKMNVADVHNLEYIIYKREDEISSLVDAYNRMVKDLSESTRQLAQAERDKAWSQMARQVAHEIKNPLTPIKLQIQRLIRLKQNGNPAWEQRFDEVSAVVLEHIDILTETANEFSTFAKLYSEEPVMIDLDKIIKDQIMIFDNKENIRISYLGMENSLVMAPKPQLIRVFVNLITNAIQAVEMHQKEAADLGEDPKEGRVMISLRNSMKDGFYDIVFDDSGAGVKEENLDKLFTPNFTTKSSGTGLGLAICRNIIEKCEGEIRYQKSFALGGASFIVTIPKYQE
ncbi:MAG: GHKL domain-containing protein [Bacteroidales bacterium]|nr:GHKL domain-containing protein [Bacteroidales bacterium]